MHSNVFVGCFRAVGGVCMLVIVVDTVLGNARRDIILLVVMLLCIVLNIVMHNKVSSIQE